MTEKLKKKDVKCLTNLDMLKIWKSLLENRLNEFFKLKSIDRCDGIEFSIRDKNFKIQSGSYNWDPSCNNIIFLFLELVKMVLKKVMCGLLMV